MIEIICNEGEKSSNVKDDIIRRPKNIKQIGEIDSNRKIYIEDYAFTFINSVAYANQELISVGVLLGEFQKNGNESYIFIKGAIKVKMPEENNYSKMHFDEKVWTSIYEEAEKYFHNLAIVGWFVAVPDITNELFSYLSKLHIDNFAGNNKTLYVLNTSEKEEDFYLYEGNELKKQRGYVCFYERNCEMQEYMLDSRGSKSVDSENQDKVTQNFRTIIQEKKEQAEQRKTASMLYCVSTFMLVVVLVIGVNIMNSYEKMQSFDESLDVIVKEISNMNVKMIGSEASTESIQNAKESIASETQVVTPVNKLDGKVYPTEEQQSQSETVGQTEQMIIDPVVAEPAKVQQYASYIVVKGDTLMSICKNKYGDTTRYKEIIALNNIDNPDKLYIGQEIKLP